MAVAGIPAEGAPTVVAVDCPLEEAPPKCRTVRGRLGIEAAVVVVAAAAAAAAAKARRSSEADRLRSSLGYICGYSRNRDS